jgi:hypothetical protein
MNFKFCMQDFMFQALNLSTRDISQIVLLGKFRKSYNQQKQICKKIWSWLHLSVCQSVIYSKNPLFVTRSLEAHLT